MAEPADLLFEIRKRRGGALLNLDRMLLHSIPFARGWNSFLKEVRENLSLNSLLRELAICVVAIINDASYEFFQHHLEYIKAGGTMEQVEALKSLVNNNFNLSMINMIFSNLELSAIELCVSMTKYPNITPTNILLKLKQYLNDSELVELVGIIATYNMVSRFLNTLEITPEIDIIPAFEILAEADNAGKELLNC